MGVERRPVHRLVACAARPGGVAAAVPETGLMTDEDLAGAEGVPVGASCRRVGDPLPGRRLYQLAQHGLELTTRHGLCSWPRHMEVNGGGAEGNYVPTGSRPQTLRSAIDESVA